MALRSAQPLNRNEYQEYFLGVKAASALSQNLGTLTSWNPLGLSRPVTGLLYHLVKRSETKSGLSFYTCLNGLSRSLLSFIPDA